MRITNALGQLLISEVNWEKLVQNHTVSKCVINNDPKPVVKLFTPDASYTWLLTEIDPETRILFWLCDLGMGFPELWSVSLDELLALKGKIGLPIERDRHIIFHHPLSYYVDKANENDRITI